MTEITHPDFVKNKLKVRLKLIWLELNYKGQPMKLSKTPLILIDDHGRQRSLSLKTTWLNTLILVLDGQEEIRPFDPLHPLTYFFMVIIMTLGALSGGILGAMISLFGALLIRNIFLRCMSLAAKVGLAILVIAAIVGVVLLLAVILRFFLELAIA